MKRHFIYAYLLCFFCLTTLGFSQDVKRIVILPFNTSAGIDVYRLGLASALQRSLNVIDGLYVPPVADTVIVTQRLFDEGTLSIETVVEAFSAQIVLSGQISGNGAEAEILIGLAGPDFPSVANISLRADATNPQSLVQAVAYALLEQLPLKISQSDRDELAAVLAQTPSLPSLNAVSETTFQPANINLSNLSSAKQLDSSSSWVTSEYAKVLALANTAQQAQELAKEATELSASDIEAWVIYGIILRSNNNFAEAKIAFERALALNPNHALALVGLVPTLDDDAKAQNSLEAALNAYPRLSQAYLELANLQFATNPQRALQTLRRGSTQTPETIALHAAFIDYALQLNDTQGALSYLKAEIAKQANPPAALYALANQLSSTFPDDSYLLIREGRNRHPDSVNLAILESELLERQSDYASAEALLVSLLASNAANSELVNRLAIVQAKQGKLEEARKTFSSLGDSNETLQINLAQLYLEAGENAAALSILEPLLSNSANDADLYAYYGLALGRTGRYQQALGAFEQSLKLNPQQRIAQEAKAQLEQQIQIVGGQTIEMSSEASNLFSQGQNSLNDRDFDNAARLFSQARALDDNGLLGFYEGYAYYFASKPRQAVSGFNKALESFPNSDIVLNNLGLVQIELGRFDLALDYLTKALSLNSSNDQAHLNLGFVHYRLNNYSQAIQEWETALKLNPGLDSAVSDLLADARAKAQ